MAHGDLFLNRSHNGRQHVYREIHDTWPGTDQPRVYYSARCSCPGTNNGHTQAAGALIPATPENARNVCKSGARFLALIQA